MRHGVEEYMLLAEEQLNSAIQNQVVHQQYLVDLLGRCLHVVVEMVDMEIILVVSLVEVVEEVEVIDLVVVVVGILTFL